MNYLEFLEPIDKIARTAGEILMDRYGKIHNIEQKGIGDLVTEADQASERFVTDELKKAFPDHSILGEEYGLIDNNSDFCWAIDPLDGTANFAQHFPIFAVSIGLLHKGIPVVGAIYDANSDRFFRGAKNCGATLNDRPISVNENWKISPDGLFGHASTILRKRDPFMQHFMKGRNLGSAALQICMVACGFFDGTIDLNTKLWDVAAGAAILFEAGGNVTKPNGDQLFPLAENSSAYRSETVAFLATNGNIHGECAEKFVASRN